LQNEGGNGNLEARVAQRSRTHTIGLDRPKPYSSKRNAWFTLATFRDFWCLAFGDFVTQRL